MLITESEKASVLRQVILDIAIDAINQRTGGGTKYINRRDEDFIVSYFKEEEYRRVLRLHKNDRVRETFYSEVLDLISAYENGLADALRSKADELGRL